MPEASGSSHLAISATTFIARMGEIETFKERSDGLREHPFSGMELHELRGSLANTGEIPYIPMDLAIPFVLVAVQWVRDHGPEITTALEQAEAAYGRAAAQGKGAAACDVDAVRALRGLRFEHPPVLDGQPSPAFLTGLRQLA
jgi:hypothetical protein